MVVLRRRGLMVGAAATLASGAVARNSSAAGPGVMGPLDLGHLHAMPGIELPAFSFRRPDGTVLTLADYRGRGVVLNLWATWCAPCVAEMPSLDRLAEAVRASGVVVLPLSSDREGDTAVTAFYRAHGVRNLPVLLDPAGDAARALGTRGIPTTLLIDKAGQERGRLEGAAAWDTGESVAMVKRLVGVAA